MHYAWLVLLVLVVVLDVETSSILLSWTGIAFIVGFVMGFMGYPLPHQMAVVGILSIILLGVGSYISKKYIKTKMEITPILTDKIIGKHLLAEESFEDSIQQKVNGIYWKIVARDGPIEKGEKLVVTEIKESKLIVAKLSDLAKKEEKGE